MDRDSSVGIATRYRLDAQGIESRWGKIFRTSPEWPCGPPSSCKMGTESFPGVKRPGRGVDHPPASSADVKERVELYLFPPSGPSWPVIGWTVPLPLPLISSIMWVCPVFVISDRPALSLGKNPRGLYAVWSRLVATGEGINLNVWTDDSSYVYDSYQTCQLRSLAICVLAINRASGFSDQ